MLNRIIQFYIAYPTVRYATVSILLVALCAALLGIILVLKRYSMIGDGLSHVSFGATAVATVLGLTTPIYVALPLTVAAAVFILKIRGSSKISGDSAVAMVSSGALVLGYLLLNLFADDHSAATDACATLFGSGILGIDRSDVLICLVLSIAVLFIFIFFYNRLFSIIFDEDFAAATGTKIGFYNTVTAVLTGVTIVIAMNLLGALLVSALIIFPALSSMRVFKTFRSVTVSAVCISVFGASVGIIASLLSSAPIGPTVVTANVCVFLIFYVIGAVRSRAR